MLHFKMTVWYFTNHIHQSVNQPEAVFSPRDTSTLDISGNFVITCSRASVSGSIFIMWWPLCPAKPGGECSDQVRTVVEITGGEAKALLQEFFGVRHGQGGYDPQKCFFHLLVQQFMARWQWRIYILAKI